MGLGLIGLGVQGFGVSGVLLVEGLFRGFEVEGAGLEVHRVSEGLPDFQGLGVLGR